MGKIRNSKNLTYIYWNRKASQGGAVWEKLRFQEILHIYIEIINQAIPAYLDAGGKEKT